MPWRLKRGSAPTDCPGVLAPLLVLCAVLCAPVTAAAQSAERYTLRGQVIDGETGKPLPDIQVVISQYPSWQVAAEPVTSGPDGRVVFYGLEAGLYTADTWLDGELIHYREMPSGTVGATRVGPDFRNAEFTFRVARHPSIGGIVRDEFGDPVPHVNVVAFRSQWIDGRLVRAVQAQTATDDRGRYRIPVLAPGAYLVCAEVANPYENDWFRSLAPEAASTVDFEAPDAPRFYRRSCYPGEPPASFKIDWGQDMPVDLKLSATPGIKVQGRVTNLNGSSAALVPVAEDETVFPAGIPVQPDGAFEFNVLEPGPYILRIEQERLVALQTIVVDKSPLTGLQLNLRPSAAVSVFIQSDAILQPDSVSIGLRETSSRRSAALWAQPGGDGSLRFPAVDPGTYWLLTRTTAPFCVASATFGGRAVLHDTLTVSSGDSARLDVVLSAQCARIDGQVIMPEHSAAFPVVLVMMSGTAESPGDVLKVDSGEDGSFSVTELPPGRYALWAWSQEDVGFPGPASLVEVANRASIVEVGKERHAVVQVKMLPGRAEVTEVK